MRFSVTLKDPDSLDDAIDSAVWAELAKIDGLDDEDRELLRDRRHKDAREVADLWFSYGEYLTVEIDTDERTVSVCRTL